MAQRTSSNVKGDLGELEIATKLLQHGMAINSLAASDTGWDLHCHVPDELLKKASSADSKRSWKMSGRTAHIQVKNSSRGPLNVGTVRGWLSGTLSGVPTFMFWKPDAGSNIYEFSTPIEFENWLGDSNDSSSEDHLDDQCKKDFLKRGWRTDRQSPLATHPYVKKRFPSVVQLWVRYPQLAFHYGGLTTWMNSAENDEPPFVKEIVEDLAVVIATFNNYRSDSDQSKLKGWLEQLYGIVYGANSDNETRVDQSVSDLESDRTFPTSDHPYIFGHVPSCVLHTIDVQSPERSAHDLLHEIVQLKRNNAIRPE